MTEFEKQDLAAVAELDLHWNKLRGKTVLISGGTGFIGQFIINVIKYRNSCYGDNINVISLSRRAHTDEDDVKYLSCDVTRKIELPFKADFVLHLASNTHPKQYASDPVGTITTNVFGCFNLLEYSRKVGARFLLASSVEIYGEGNGEEITENYCGYIDCNTSRAGYNEAKRVSESLCQSYRAQYGLDCVIVRLARCFGADKKDDSKAVAQFINKALNGENVVLKSYGKQRFSYCYVADAASGILKVLTDGKDGEAYNVAGEDEGLNLGDYAKLIAEYAATNVIFDVNSTDNAGVSKANYAVMDCSKLKALGWAPLYAVSEALKRTMDILKVKR